MSAPPADPGNVPPLDPVVMVVQGAAVCGGVAISEEVVVTAAHCVALGDGARIERRDGARFHGRVIARDVGDDVAVVLVPDAALSFAPLAVDAPRVGQGVFAVGHPYGGVAGGFLSGTLAWSVSGGAVSAVGDRAVQITAPVNPGNSGGPVFDDAGAVVGVVSRRLRGDGLGFASSSASVARVVDEGRDPLLGGELWLGARAGRLGAWDGAIAVGGLAELSIRDRVVLGGAASWPVSGRWDALRLGTTRWAEGEGRAGLRVRFGGGPATTRLDAFGGLASVAVWEVDPDLVIARSRGAAGLVGGAARLGDNGIELVWVHGSGLAASLVVGVPGRVTTW